jgi:DNA recombination protein RmuC
MGSGGAVVDVEQVIIPIVAGNVALVACLVWLIFHLRSQLRAVSVAVGEALPGRLDTLRGGLEEKFRAATTDMAARLADTKGDLRQQTVDRLNTGFGELRDTLERQLSAGRQEQAKALKLEISDLTRQTGENLGAIRAELDKKLLAIGDQVTHKLDENIKEGFKQFEKVQEHLRAAEEQLRNVNLVGSSINDLNNLLKLPHMRGRFGEASLERLLEDFLPASMYELQAAAGANGQGRADAVIKFPERVLPIDAKFPREQVLALFESNDPVQLAAAREQFRRVMKEQGRRIAAYIHPENGTTDMALMYLPSETLYMEAVLSGEVSEWLNKQHIFPVSPNTLIVTLQAIQMVFRMYEFAKSYERATEELQKAQAAFGHFEKQFEKVGSSLGNAQQAWEVARNHLNRYRNRVTNLTGEMPTELPNGQNGLEGNLDAK